MKSAGLKNIKCGNLSLVKDARTYIMGIINLTPDSFSDGGLYNSPKSAVDYALKLLDHGADLIDVGGISTAPGAPYVSIEEELERVVPVIKALLKARVYAISVDTSRAHVALRALDAKACWINIQEAEAIDESMAELLTHAEGSILMHRRGQRSGVEAGEAYVYKNIIQEISDFFLERRAYLESFGVKREKLIFDPGVGFGKGLGDSLKIINNMRAFNQGFMNMLGVSRKSFLASITNIKDPKERDYAGLGAMAAGVMSGAHILRVHNVKAAFDMTRVLDTCYKGQKDENLY